MAHRGRLNVLSNILKKPAEEIFSEFESCYDPQDLVGSGRRQVSYRLPHRRVLEDGARFPFIW
jgi:2-oxoglutarate dehydrogenase complex dehydrogenase (E1) component-like enzyme